MAFLSKDQINDKLVEYDFPLIRLLFVSFWFRLVFLGFMGLMIGVPLCVLKLWKTTPSDVEAVVKVSVVDLVQGWSLERSAEEAEKDGRFDDAVYAWRNAIANNLADADRIRSLIAYLIEADHSKTHWRAGAIQSYWLLELTRTNSQDLELTTRMLQHYEMDSYSISLLEQCADQLDDMQESRYLRALFDEGYPEKFGNRLRQRGEAIEIDSTLELYVHAYHAGWGDPRQAAAGREALALALLDPAKDILAHRLRLKTVANSNNLAEFVESFEFLKRRFKDKGPDHVMYWRLLMANGRQQEAVALAKGYNTRPDSYLDALRFGDIYAELGLNDLAGEYLEHYAPDFNYAPAFWDVRARLLAADEKWNEMVALALEIRNNPRLRDALYGHSFYIEGRAKLGLERGAEARAAFERISEAPYQNPGLALNVGANLVKLQYFDVAREVLLPVREEFDTSYAYWSLLHHISYYTKDDDLLLLTTENIFRIRPTSWIAKSNYASCLVALRQKPAEAIKLTFELLSDQPDSRYLKINHALALVVNHRFEEASEVLDGIDTNGLSDAEAAGLNLVMFEVNLHRENIPEAVRISSRIDRSVLFPSERNWLEAKLEDVRARL